MNNGLVKQGFQVTAFWEIKGNARVSMRAFQEMNVWDVTFFHHVRLRLFTIISWRSIFLDLLPDYNSIMLRAWCVPPHSLLAFRAFLHNIVFPNEMDHQHGLLITLIRVPNMFIAGDIWSLLFMCYSSQRLTGLETANTEWIVGDLFEAWNFPASRAITFQTRNVLCWSWTWTLEYFLPSSGSHAWEGLSVFIKMIFLFCDVDL